MTYGCVHGCVVSVDVPIDCPDESFRNLKRIHLVMSVRVVGCAERVVLQSTASNQSWLNGSDLCQPSTRLASQIYVQPLFESPDVLQVIHFTSHLCWIAADAEWPMKELWWSRAAGSGVQSDAMSWPERCAHCCSV